MDENFQAMAVAVQRYLAGDLPLVEAAQRVVDLGYGENFTLGAESPGQMQRLDARGASQLVWAVARVLQRQSRLSG